jgi:hypothetical protein
MGAVRDLVLKDLSEVSRQGKAMDKCVIASEVNGKYLCFAEHNSLHERCSKVA